MTELKLGNIIDDCSLNINEIQMDFNRNWSYEEISVKFIVKMK